MDLFFIFIDDFLALLGWLGPLRSGLCRCLRCRSLLRVDVSLGVDPGKTRQRHFSFLATVFVLVSSFRLSYLFRRLILSLSLVFLFDIREAQWVGESTKAQ
jgi:hypothetical protein